MFAKARGFGFGFGAKPKIAADTIKIAADWKANLVRTSQTNKGNAIASWEEDVFFTLRG